MVVVVKERWWSCHHDVVVDVCSGWCIGGVWYSRSMVSMFINFPFNIFVC